MLLISSKYIAINITYYEQGANIPDFTAVGLVYAVGLFPA